jgi:hypothetical protein
MADERRTYYKLTGAGRAALEAELKRYLSVVARKDGLRMATDVPGRRYRAWYAILLRLYPRPFHERFGEGMAQTFRDLCRERRDARRGLAGLALWIFFETLVGIVRVVALGLLMVPLVASRVVDGWMELGRASRVGFDVRRFLAAVAWYRRQL